MGRMLQIDVVYWSTQLVILIELFTNEEQGTAKSSQGFEQ